MSAVSEKKYEIYAAMSCDGCKGAITRILNKVEGITSFNCDVTNKTVTVQGTASKDSIMEKLNKWSSASGKEVRFVKEY